nr:MAG TPA: hypothetical protein [Caudoviricetes sp.]
MHRERCALSFVLYLHILKAHICLKIEQYE